MFHFSSNKMPQVWLMPHIVINWIAVITQWGNDFVLKMAILHLIAVVIVHRLEKIIEKR